MPEAFRPRAIRAGLLTALAFAALAVLAGSAFAADVRVSNGSPATPFSQNKQNEPTLAVDAHNPQTLVAGSNDEIDMESCSAGDPTTCPFTPNVGTTGAYFSFDGGRSWTQPTYTGLTGRDCLGPAACTAHTGPIGTLPNYAEAGLVSDGDPAAAFGPRRGADGKFSWANGSRLYFANLASNIGAKSDAAFKGFEAIAVSYADDLHAAAAGGAAGKAAWSSPVIVSKQTSSTFSDKEQIWADNAASSKYFGSVYVCHADFRSNSHGNGAPEPIVLSTSRDGGQTWTNQQISAATVNNTNPGRDGCTLRTDHNGGLYVYYRGVDPKTKVEAELQVRSFDGGKTFDGPRAFTGPAETVGTIDPTILRPVEDGLAGARADLAPAPSVDIANGAPTGNDATDEVVMAWANGDSSPFHYGQALYSYSTNHGASFAAPKSVPLPAGDHAYYLAPGVSPDGSKAYVAYNSFTTPFQPTTSTPRSLVGGLLSANIGAGGDLGGWTSIDRGAAGDPRGSSQNNLVAEFLGDYVYAVGTRNGGAGVWNDMRNGADCPQVDTYRQAYEDAVKAGSIPPNAQEDSPADDGSGDAAVKAPKGSGGTPPPAPDIYGSSTPCPGSFGNSDIYGASTIAP